MNKADNNIVLAKPSGITLEQHNKDVVKESLSICQVLPASLSKYSKMVGKDLTNLLCASAEWHDEGKKHNKWQTACWKDYQNYKVWKTKNPEGNFLKYSKECQDEAGENLRKNNFRHEMESLRIVDPQGDLLMSQKVAIAAHHSKLGSRYEDKWKACEAYSSIWKEFRRTSSSITLRNDFSLLCSAHMKYDAIRGLLQLADHRASAKEEMEDISSLEPFSYTFPYSQKRGVQKIVEDNWKKDLLLLRAPTGAGKTDAALLWASKQIEAQRADRLIFAMPTRFTANAISVNVSKELGQTGLYHSSAWSAISDKVKNNEISLSDALNQHKMARCLLSPITVCTIDHLLMSLTMTREDHHLISYNLANSCVVIDEADFYDDFTLANIQYLLKVLHEWKVPVLIMSASLPDSSLSLYQSTGYKIDSILEDSHDVNNIRKRFEIKDIIDYNEIKDIDPLIEKCFEIGNGILYMNTVDSAIALYKHICSDKKRTKEEIEYVHLYHSRFTEPDKLKKEEKIIKALGKKAWGEGTAKGIVIMTQIGEMSINISSEIMISELCPIDRMIQRTGRLCRFSDDMGKLYILIPYRNKTIYPAPYGILEDNCWIPSKAFLVTKDVLQLKCYSSDDMTVLLNDVYKEKFKFSSDAKRNVGELEKMFKYNWLICPKDVSDEDDVESKEWRSRNIVYQDDVFVCPPPTHQFRNYSEFLEYKLLYAISLPEYLVIKGKNKLNRIDPGYEVKIGKNSIVRLNVVRTGFYDDKKGLDLTREDNFL